MNSTLAFLTYLEWVTNLYQFTFSFHSQSTVKRILKGFCIIAFIIPITAIVLISAVSALLNILFSKILLIGIIWSPLTGLLAFISYKSFALANLPECKDYLEFQRKVTTNW